MNIIEALKIARSGQKIRSKSLDRERHGLSESLKHQNDFHFSWSELLADDWEVVKTLKTEEMTMGELRKRNGVHVVEPAGPVSTHIPNRAKVVITWEE